MTDNESKQKKAFPPQPDAEDLSKEIEQSMERQPDERCKVVRVFDDCYRCNWWAPDKTPHPFWITGGTIRKSRFLRATKTSGELLIDSTK